MILFEFLSEYVWSKNVEIQALKSKTDVDEKVVFSGLKEEVPFSLASQEVLGVYTNGDCLVICIKRA